MDSSQTACIGRMSIDQSRGGQRDFATTHWSLVLAAGDVARPQAKAALARLCEKYWYPLYAYVRRRISNIHEAQYLTHAFSTPIGLWALVVLTRSDVKLAFAADRAAKPQDTVQQ
jgi:hypothetical protein